MSDLQENEPYATPKSNLIDQHNDPMRPSAAIITLTILVVLIEVVLSLAVVASNRFNHSNSLGIAAFVGYVLFVVAIGPGIIALVFQLRSKFRNSRARTNLFFFSSLVFAVLQIFYLTGFVR